MSRDTLYAFLTFCSLVTVSCGRTQELSHDVLPEPTAKPQEDLFANAYDNLNRLSEYAPGEILDQSVERLNQWAASENPQAPWKPDPAIETLPGPLRIDKLDEQLASTEFAIYDPPYFRDGHFLRQAIWMREIAEHVCQGAVNDLEKAERLFDWTVLTVCLDGKPAPDETATAYWPWETILFGHGQAIDRAWVFMQLARQQQLDVVLLAVREEGDRFRAWCPALLQGTDLYPFDCTLGVTFLAEGELATLAQLAANDSWLRQMDTAEEKYPLEARQLEQVVALIEASPGFLTRRMRMVESRLAGDRKLVLTVSPAALSKRLQECPHVANAVIWDWPYRLALLRALPDSPPNLASHREFMPFHLKSLQRALPRPSELVEQDEFGKPPVAARETSIYAIWAGRLRHIEGHFRKPDTERDKDPEEIDRREGAKSLYLLARSTADQVATNALEVERAAAEENRRLATFWLGQISFEEGEYAIAIDWYQRYLESWAEGALADAARYNQARAYQELGDSEKAIELYRADRSASRPGSLLRAARLEAEAAKFTPPQAEDPK